MEGESQMVAKTSPAVRDWGAVGKCWKGHDKYNMIKWEGKISERNEI